MIFYSYNLCIDKETDMTYNYSFDGISQAKFMFKDGEVK